MKNISTLIKYTGLATLLFLATDPTIGSTSQYIAHSSGDWSNIRIWGNHHPNKDLCQKTIVIPAGVKVNLDVPIQSDERIELIVNGKLRSKDVILNLSNIRLTGNGEIDVEEAIADSTTVFLFTGEFDVVSARLADGHFPIQGVFNVNESLTLSRCELLLKSGELSFRNKSKLVVNSSYIDTAGGELSAYGSLDLYYIGDGNPAGPELGIPNVQTINISLDNLNASVDLTRDMKITADVIIKSGRLNLNGYDLVSYGELNCVEEGVILGNRSSTLTLGANSELAFADERGMLRSLIIGGKKTHVELRDALLVYNMLDLSYGRMDLNRNKIRVLGEMRKTDFFKLNGNTDKFISLASQPPSPRFSARTASAP